MEAFLVMARVDGLCDLAFDHDAHMVGLHQRPARGAHALGGGQRRRSRRRGGVGEQAVDPVAGHRELGVVVIVGVNGDAVGERREAGRGRHRGADHRGRPAGAAEGFEMGAHDAPAGRHRTGERQPEPVEDRLLAQLDHVVGDVVDGGGGDEVGDMGGERGCGR